MTAIVSFLESLLSRFFKDGYVPVVCGNVPSISPWSSCPWQIAQLALYTFSPISCIVFGCAEFLSFKSSVTICCIHGISFAFTYRIPVSTSKDAPPHSAPPSNPGKYIVPCVLGGINCSPVRTVSNIDLTYS